MIYLSTPYTGSSKVRLIRFLQRQRNIYLAWRLNGLLWAHGIPAWSPVLNTANFELITPLTYFQYLAYDKSFLMNFDAIVMAPNWERSNGCREEYELAKKLGLKIFVLPRDTKLLIEYSSK